MKKQLRKSADSDATLTTFSTRLTPAQQDLVVRAAESRGWSVAHLIRVAVLEKAAHIVNTSQPNRFNFRAIARRLADQITAPRAWVLNDVTQESRELDEFLESVSDSSGPLVGMVDTMASKQMAELELAMNYGGAEFFRLVLDQCDPSKLTDASQLPEPVDPSNFSTVSEE